MNIQPITDTDIETASGRFLDLMNPEPSMISHTDIAQGLSRCCRFAGQTQTFYSVAEHSVLVADLAPRLLGPQVVANGPLVKLTRQCALLHDASEAYIGDMTAPAKRVLRALSTRTMELSPYDKLEDRLTKAILQAYDLPSFAGGTIDAVHKADLWAFRWEAAALMPSRGEDGHYRFPDEVLELGPLPYDLNVLFGRTSYVAERAWMRAWALTTLP